MDAKRVRNINEITGNKTIINEEIFNILFLKIREDFPCKIYGYVLGNRKK